MKPHFRLCEGFLPHEAEGSTGKRLKNQYIKIYNKPELCNYFCTKECQIGKRYVPEVQTIHDLPQIAMELLSNLNALNRDKDRLIDITADGKITADEHADFEIFRQHLSDMSLAIETLKLWADKELTV